MRSNPSMPAIGELRLFDSCVTLGRSCLKGVPQYLTSDSVLATMDRCDISEALVHSNEARMVLPRQHGNERLLRELAGIERLHPVWVLSPPKKPDRAGARKQVDEMLAAGVRAARLMMGIVPPFHWIWKDLCEALEEHRVPCLLDFAEPMNPATASVPTDFALNALREICLAHPALPMILSHASGGLGLAASTLPLLYRVPNLMMDITSVVDYWREVASEAGPERVVFASGMPFYDPSILVSNVQYEPSLSVQAKKRICGENVRALLEAVR